MIVKVTQIILKNLQIFNKLEVLAEEDYSVKYIFSCGGTVCLDGSSHADKTYETQTSTIRDGQKYLQQKINEIKYQLESWRKQKQNLEKSNLLNKKIVI